jgi:hypothetical protein
MPALNSTGQPCRTIHLTAGFTDILLLLSTKPGMLDRKSDKMVDKQAGIE